MNGTICGAFSPNVACIFLCNLRNEVPMDTCTLVDFAAYHVRVLNGKLNRPGRRSIWTQRVN